MNIKLIKLPPSREQRGDTVSHFKPSGPIILLIVLMLLWCFAPIWLHNIDETAGSVDQSIWLLIVLSLISFLLVCALCWWLFQHFLVLLGLPTIDHMVSQFNILELWQQLSFYYASFALLLAAALGCLAAIC